MKVNSNHLNFIDTNGVSQCFYSYVGLSLEVILPTIFQASYRSISWKNLTLRPQLTAFFTQFIHFQIW